MPANTSMEHPFFARACTWKHLVSAKACRVAGRFQSSRRCTCPAAYMPFPLKVAEVYSRVMKSRRGIGSEQRNMVQLTLAGSVVPNRAPLVHKCEVLGDTALTQ